MRQQTLELLYIHSEQMNIWMCPCFPVSSLVGHRTGQTDLKIVRGVSWEVVCVTGQAVFLIGLELWTRGCLGNVDVIFFFFCRKVGDNRWPDGRRETRWSAYDRFCSRMLPDLFGLPLGGSIDSTSLLLKRNFRNDEHI